MCKVHLIPKMCQCGVLLTTKRSAQFKTNYQTPGGTLKCRSDRYASRKFFWRTLKYPDFDYKLLKNTQIAILRAVLGEMASIFQKFSRRL